MKKQIGFLKTLLNNHTLLRWVKKFSADGIQEELNGLAFDIETDESSICVTDTSAIKMLFSSARFNGKSYISFDLKQIKETLAMVEGEGRLIINDSKQLGYIQTGNDVIVIAPTSEEEVSKKEKVKKKSPKKEKVEEVAEDSISTD